MTKDKSIHQLIDLLKSNFGQDTFEFVDNWESDLCAIGVKKGNKMIYISTCNYIDKSVEYDIDFELIDNPDQYNLIEEKRAISLNDLLSTIKEFLEVC
ncbi:MAG: hypothetical protein EOP51_02790 [Sphingobacteriales bacterium]|nr:MAG: hypothetical protein EOP51_02790 [Sphingobacteriales bacterium]